MRAAGSTTVSKGHWAGNIDRQAHPELLSDTLMHGATVRPPGAIPVAQPAGRAHELPRPFLRVAAAIALIVFTGAATLYAGQSKPKSKKLDNRHQIEQLEEAWRTAVLKSDTAALGSLLADDYIAITASGTLQTKDEALASVRSGRAHITSIDFSDRKLRFYGHTALVTSIANIKAGPTDIGVTGSYRYTRVYVLEPQGKWKIVSFEVSRIRFPGDRR